MTTRKKRKDWTQAGFRRLEAEGIDSVRVESLAKDLQVTKGSFYWHFGNREDLLKAMLEEWRESATLAVIAQTEAAGPEPLLRIEHLWVLSREGFNGRLEMALRSWGSTDTIVSKAIESVDSERIGYLRRLLRASGFEPAATEARAFLLYSTLLGNHLLPDSHGRFSRKRVLEEVLALLISDA